MKYLILLKFLNDFIYKTVKLSSVIRDFVTVHDLKLCLRIVIVYK